MARTKQTARSTTTGSQQLRHRKGGAPPWQQQQQPAGDPPSSNNPNTPTAPATAGNTSSDQAESKRNSSDDVVVETSSPSSPNNTGADINSKNGGNSGSVGLMLAWLGLVAVSMTDLWLTPHSKVEESFALQATHDLYYHGITPALHSYYNNNKQILSLWSGQQGVDEQQQQQNRSVQELPYDHLQYPGVVPRTFLGPWLLSNMARFVTTIIRVDAWWDNPANVQLLMRGLLLALHMHAWYRFAVATTHCVHWHATNSNNNKNNLSSTTTNNVVGIYVLLITACQFHIPFYASRMLPNVFATIVMLHAYTHWLLQEQKHNHGRGVRHITIAAALTVFTCTAIRCDMILALFTLGLSWIFVQQFLTIRQALQIGIVTGLLSLVLTVPLDSILWKPQSSSSKSLLDLLLWPEGVVLFYNTVLNKSSDWGVSAWHWYFTAALPKALLLTSLAIPVALVGKPLLERVVGIITTGANTDAQASKTTKRRLRFVSNTWLLPYFLPAIGFVVLYSYLGHKEVRFLFPILPLFNFAAAVGMNELHQLAAWTEAATTTSTKASSRIPRSIVFYRIVYVLGVVGVLLLSLFASITFVAVSRWNYPGGVALERLTAHVSAQQQTLAAATADATPLVRVYVDVASAMTGISLFGQRAASWATNTTRRQSPLSPKSVQNEFGKDDWQISWEFVKAGYEEEHVVDKNSNNATHVWDSFTHLLTENETLGGSDFEVVERIPGNPKLNLRRRTIVTSDTIFLLENKKWASDMNG